MKLPTTTEINQKLQAAKLQLIKTGAELYCSAHLLYLKASEKLNSKIEQK